MLKIYDGLELAWLWLYFLMELFRYSGSLPFYGIWRKSSGGENDPAQLSVNHLYGVCIASEPAAGPLLLSN
jgi:hypothetical protein